MLKKKLPAKQSKAKQSKAKQSKFLFAEVNRTHYLCDDNSKNIILFSEINKLKILQTIIYKNLIYY